MLDGVWNLGRQWWMQSEYWIKGLPQSNSVLLISINKLRTTIPARLIPLHNILKFKHIPRSTEVWQDFKQKTREVSFAFTYIPPLLSFLSTGLFSYFFHNFKLVDELVVPIIPHHNSSLVVDCPNQTTNNFRERIIR